MSEMDEKLPSELLETISVNGVNAVTGDYAVAPLPNADLARRIKGLSEPDNLSELRAKKGRPVDSPVSEAVEDPTDLAQAGWAVVFPAAMDGKRCEAIKEALGPLLDHRKVQAGEFYRLFEGESGYQANDNKRDFCARQSPEIKRGPARPEQMPFYVMLVGSPEEIDYEFQYQLDVMRGVGRIDFGYDLDAYARYAQSVVAAETGKVKLPRRAAFYSVRNPNDDATLISDRYLVRPLLANVQQPKLKGEIPLKFDWEFSQTPSGAKAELARLLSGKDQTPAFLFTASHGLVYSPGDGAQQRREQGALIGQSWVRGTPPVRDDYFTAEDVDDANLLGLVAMFFACFGVGTPQYDYYTGPSAAREQIAARDFTSALPKRMLSQGALAVIGHVDRAWGHSFISPGSNVEIDAFVTAMRKLLNGDPVGLATDPSFNLKYADMTAVLSDVLKNIKYDPVDDKDLVKLWTANNDARSYVVLGDPAVRIPFVPADGQAVERAAVPIALPQALAKKLGALEVEIGPDPTASFAADEPIKSGGDIKIDEEHRAVVDQDFAVQIDQITQSLKDFGDKIATAVKDATQKILTLEVRTYTTDDLKTVTSDDAGNAQLRALTFVDFDGDMKNYVPTTSEGVDEELWKVHLEMVREAQTNRAQFLSAMAKLASDLLGMIKTK
jgi:hypothetical protein